MKAVKSIFEKSYILKAQAEKAMVKEFGDDAGRYEAVAKADVIPARYVIVEKAAFMADDLPANPEELDFPIHPELAAAELQMPWIADAKAAEEALDERVPGFSHCPSCNVHLSNGVGEDGQEVNGQIIHHKAKQYECLGCGEEFGPDLMREGDRVANATMEAAGPRPRLSTCEKPTKKVWHIADSMPKASRKEVIEECVRQGIAYGTSRTQYQAWFKASQEAMRGDIRKPYEKV